MKDTSMTSDNKRRRHLPKLTFRRLIFLLMYGYIAYIAGKVLLSS